MAFVFLRQTGKAFLISVKRLIFFFGKCLKNSINCCISLERVVEFSVEICQSQMIDALSQPKEGDDKI